jgi:prephenate dehydratase|tara:strand:+ start:336 stop:1172 length:837 start_codon:yes stop_codon:yes gene_type:complete
MKLGYLGPSGTYSEEAAHNYSPDAEMVSYPSIPTVIAAVEKREIDQCVVPIENSLHGTITDVIDFLVRTDSIRIAGELAVPIDHCLMAKPGTKIADITMVFSHPQSLGQSRKYLATTLSHVQAVTSLSNAQAVIDMQESDTVAGAIAPLRAAEIYGAEVLAEAVQDNPNNYTRFVVLDDSDSPPTGNDMTSVAFQFSEDEPGLLYQALGVLKENSINIVKIESRPTGERLGRYTFLLDIELHRTDPVGGETIEKLTEMSSWFKVFGSYPRMKDLPIRG